MGKEDKKEPFLVNLGRATMRGLRRCQKCGTLNGTRGYSCKNKNCDVVFKEAGDKKKGASEPCKINTGTSTQIYSVRVRDKGPDYRGFVQLSNTLHSNSNILLNDDFAEPAILLQGARCFVESCQKLAKFSVSPHSSNNACSHIKAVIQCYKDAEPLALKNSVLNTLPIPSEFKEEIYQLATDTSGPLVQRVSKSLVVVKCKPDAMHPLGFLHFSFIQTKNKKEYHKFYCSCRSFKFHPTTKETYRKCVHLYACIVAFASDERLSSEFRYFIDFIKPKDLVENLCLDVVVQKQEMEDSKATCESEGEEISEVLGEDMRGTEDNMEEVSERSFFILNDAETGTPCQVEVEVVGSDPHLMELPLNSSSSVCADTDEGLHLHTSDGGTISVHQIPDNISLSGMKRKQDESIVQASSALLTLQKSANKKANLKRLPPNLTAKKLKEFCEEFEVSYFFTSWIGSVTERINQSMHYGFSGKPDPLVFHLPKTFFDCLMVRINKCIGTKKRKLVQEMQSFIRKDAVPLGKFTKYTWKLTSLGHVQEIFFNSEVPLEPVRYFSLQKDGSFKLASMPLPLPNSSLNNQSGTQLIRPQEYKTILRVGPPSLSQVGGRDSSPFIIEWIPDILPKSQIGELRLKYEYDHYCNGQYVIKQNATSLPPPILVSKGPLKPSSKLFGPPLAPRPPQKSLNSSVSNSDNVFSIPISSDNLSSENSITLLTF